VAEESKSIALVILGIVAVIAIVGLVLLFTGARKGATGEYYVGAKEYGGAIKGIMEPYARAYSGKAWDRNYANSQFGNLQFSATGSTGKGASLGQSQTYGDYGGKTSTSVGLSYARDSSQVPSAQTSCAGLGIAMSASTDPQVQAFGDYLTQFTQPASLNQYYNQYGPENCIKLSDLPAVVGTIVNENNPGYALYTGIVDDLQQTGDFACCKNTEWNTGPVV